MRAIVGITCTTNNSGDKATLALSYINSLMAADVIPVLLYLDKDSVVDILPKLDGIVLSGGGDIEQKYSKATQADSVNSLRDEFELELIQKANIRGIPIMGICRGIQVINVAFGGTLIGHIDGHNALEHNININKNTMIYDIYGEKQKVNSFHHQSIDRIADGFTVAAMSDDGIIEAIEMERIIGVQWHPERMNNQQALFMRFSRMCHLQNK